MRRRLPRAWLGRCKLIGQIASQDSKAKTFCAQDALQAIAGHAGYIGAFPEKIEIARQMLFSHIPACRRVMQSG